MNLEGFEFPSDNKTVVETSHIIYITAFSYKDFIQ